MGRFYFNFFTRYFFALIIAVGVSFAFLSQSAHSQFNNPVPAGEPAPVVPVLRDSVSGRGTNFSIVTLNGSTITLTSGQAVEVSLMGRESAVTVYLEAAPPLFSVRLNVSGLKASTTYFIREDGIEKSELFSSAGGEITFMQDVSGPRSLLIQSERSTVYIRADGSIYPPTAPISAAIPGSYYYLMANLSEPLVIQRNHITLDGAGYAIAGAGQALGLDVSGRLAVAVSNLTVRGFYTGVSFSNSTQCTLAYSAIVTNSRLGITQSGGSDNLYQGNTVKNPADYADQMRLYYASNITVQDNVLGRDGLPDYGYGIELYRTASSAFTRNKISHTNSAVYMARSNNNVVSLSTFTSNNLAMEFYWGGNTAENNAVNSNWTGIHLASYYDPYYPPAQYPGSGAPNTIRGNTVQNSRSSGILSEG